MSMGEIGRLIGGRYRVDRDLERGADTQSLLVTDQRSGRPCVLRQLSVAAVSAAAARRFESQAAILAKLDHPGLPRFIDGFSEGEGAAAVRVVVTSYHPGENLERLVAKGRPLTESQALVLLRRLVPVLAYLHAFEPPLVHRTISATGIILGPDGRPCLTDLDFAGAEPALPAAEHAPPGPAELARAAPEVFMGGALPASDIYSLGLAVCRGMTEKDPASLLREGARLQLRSALGVSEAFAAVLARMLEPSLERRYADDRALEADLAKFAAVRGFSGQQLPARPADEARPRREARPALLIGAAAALGVLAVLTAGVVFLRKQPAPVPSLVITPAPRQPAAVPAPPAGTGAATEPAPAPSPAADPAPVSVAPASAPPPEPAAQRAAAAAPALPEPSVTVQPPAPALPPTAASPSDATTAVVEGRLRLDGKPFTGTGAPVPVFWLRNEGTKAVEKPKMTRAADVFTVHDLAPGRYGMSVRIDFNPANPSRFPGDLDAWSQFTIEAGRPVSIEVPLRRIIRLVQPVDSNGVIPGWDAPCGSANVRAGQIVFAWEPLPVAANYQARIDRLICGRGYASAGTVFSRSTTEAWVKVELPPSADGECYSFSLTARAGEAPIGIMTTHGTTGIGWDYRFTVAER